jgi:Skp family chaperone for outer membrane proteins
VLSAVIALGVGGVAGRPLSPVAPARAEGVVWAAPGMLELLDQEPAVPQAVAGRRMVKLGFINSQSILELHPQVPGLRRALEAQLRQWQQEQTDLGTRGEALRNELRTGQFTPNQRRAKEAELNQVLEDFGKYQTDIWAPGGQAERKEQELLQPVIDAIDTAIREIAEGENYDLIFDAGGAGGSIIFGHKDLDLTRRVLDKLGIKPPTGPGEGRS